VAKPSNPPRQAVSGSPRTTARLRPRAFLGAAVIIAVAAAVALTIVITRARAWQLPLAIADRVLLLAGCVFIFPRLLALLRTVRNLAGDEELSAKDRIQFEDDRRKLQNDVHTALLQAIVGGRCWSASCSPGSSRPPVGRSPTSSPSLAKGRSASGSAGGRPARHRQHRRASRRTVRAGAACPADPRTPPGDHRYGGGLHP
jgi:hypothetical protein